MSFRKYGGITHSATNNIVKSHFSTSDNQTISNTLGQINSKIVSNSHLDLNKNSLLNVNTIYFDDGTMQNTAYLGGVQSSSSGPLTIDGLKSINGKIEVTYPLNVSSTTTLNNGLTVSSGQVKISDLLTIDKHIFLRNIKTDVPILPIYPSIIFYDNTSISSADGMLWPKTYEDNSNIVTGICNPNYVHGGEVKYVGIGTNKPQCILHIGGEFRIDNNDLEKITVFKVNRFGDIDMSRNIHMGGNIINSTSTSLISLFETSSNIKVGNTSGTVTINSTEIASVTDGALVVKGGVSISNNVYISGGVSDKDPLKNALYVTGGIGLNGNYLVSSTDQSFNLLPSSSSINMGLNTSEGTVIINSTKHASETDGALIVNGGINTKQNVYIDGSASSLDPQINALYVTGGIGLKGNYLVSSTDQSFNLLPSSSSINIGTSTDTGTVTINSTKLASNIGGALIVNGGIRVAKTSYFDTSANVFITNTDSATATLDSGSLVVKGGVSISKNVYIFGADSSKDSSSNALYVAGGIGLNGNYLVSSSSDQSFNLLTASSSINIGTSTNIGTVTINSTKPATNTGTTGGALIVNGGIRVAKTSYFDTSANVFITNTDNATATLGSGSLVVSGGVSISKNVYISGTDSSNNSSSNALYVAGGIGLNGNYLVSSSTDQHFNLLTKSSKIFIGTDSGTVIINSASNPSIINTSSGIYEGGLIVNGGTRINGSATIYNLEVTNNLTLSQASTFVVGGALTVNGSTNVERMTVGGDLTVNGFFNYSKLSFDGDIKVTTGIITTDALSASIFSTNALSLNIGRSATTINMGADLSGNTDSLNKTIINNHLKVKGGLSIDGSLTLLAGLSANTLNVTSGQITTDSSYAKIFDLSATRIDIGSNATFVNIGADLSGNTFINNRLTIQDRIVVNNGIQINNGEITSLLTTASIFDASVNKLNIGGQSVNTHIGSSESGTTAIGNDLIVNNTITANKLNPIVLIDDSILFSTTPALDYSMFGNTWGILNTISTFPLTNMNITSIAISATGQYLTVTDGSGNGNIYTSDDYGKTLSLPTTIDISGNWKSVSISANGKYQTAVQNIVNGKLYKSIDYGNTWTKGTIDISGNGNLKKVSISADGKYQTAITDTNIYISSDYGNTWTSKFKIFISSNPSAITNVFNANNVVVQNMNTVISSYTALNIAITALNIATIPIQSSTISTTSNIESLQSNITTDISNIELLETIIIAQIKDSSDCTKKNSLINVFFLIETLEDGLDQLEKSNTALTQAISVLATNDATTITDILSKNIVTTNSIPSPIITDSSSNTLQCISVSATGQYQTIVITGYQIYISTDYGLSWNKSTTNISGNWSSLAISATGKYQTAVQMGPRGKIYYSTDYGAHWTNSNTDLMQNFIDWSSISMTSSGQYQSAILNVFVGWTSINNMYTSSDYGITWTNSNSNSNSILPIILTPASVAVSSNGQYQINYSSNSIYLSITPYPNLNVSSDATINNITIGRGLGQYDNNTVVGNLALSSNISGENNTVVGKSALSANTTGKYNTAMGGAALSKNIAGSNNTAIGTISLNKNTNDKNTAIGYSSLFNNTNGSSNTAIGYSADVSVGGLTNATAIGANAKVTESNRIQLGDTLVTRIDTSGSIYSGGLNVNSDAFKVDGNGIATFSTNWLRVWNGGNTTSTAIGVEALLSNVNGHTNTAIGYQSLKSNINNRNTAIGYRSLVDTINGSSNTAIGFEADVSVGGLTNATAIGANAKVTADNRIQLGDTQVTRIDTSGSIYSGGLNVNNVFKVDGNGIATFFTDTNDNGLKVWNGGHTTGTAIGIGALGSNHEEANTAIGWKSLISNYYGKFNTAIGYQSLSQNSNNNNTAIGYNSLFSNTNGSSNTAIGSEADVSVGGLTNATAIGANAKVSTSNCIQLGYNVTRIDTSGSIYSGGLNVGSSDQFSVKYNGETTVSSLTISNLSTGIAHISSGVVTCSPVTKSELDDSLQASINGISKNPSFTTIQVAGDGTNLFSVTAEGVVTANTFNAKSDYRIKENVQQLDPTLFNVDKLNPVTYNKIDSGKQDIGFIAHEVQEVFPCLVTGEKDGEQTQSLNYLGLIGVLVKEIQELKKRVAILENK